MSKLIVSIFLFSFGLLILSYRYWGYSSELKNVEGIIESYSFSKTEDGRGGTNYRYFVSLKKDSIQYQLPAKFKDEFNQKDFKAEVKIGDEIKMEVGDIVNLINGNMTIYGLRTKSKIYLESVESKKSDKQERNIAIPFLFVFFSLIGWINFRQYRQGK